MNFKRVGMTLFLVLLIVVLIFMNIGLNISGPYHYQESKNQSVLETVQKRFPAIHDLYRHVFKYVTYSFYNDNTVYLFDYEGKLVVQREFDISRFDEIKEICYQEYGLEDVDVQIGFGYDNLVFVVEKDERIILFDYDTNEVVYYLRGNIG
ncbi:MAG: hypothetical protein ACI4U3_04110 [Traorella sp.]